MPTILSHIAVPLALKLGIKKSAFSRRMLVFAIFCAVLPDLDVIAFKLGILYESQWGHRGFSHSIGLSVMVGCLAAIWSRFLKVGRVAAFFIPSLVILSHSILDMATNGGLGCAFFWPFSDERYFLPWRPIQVSPLHPRHWMSERFLRVLQSELLYVWVPALSVSGGLVALQQGRKALMGFLGQRRIEQAEQAGRVD